MNLAKRIANLERVLAPTRDHRLVLRFEGSGSEALPQPTQEELEVATDVMTVVFVEATDGRPVHPEQLI